MHLFNAFLYHLNHSLNFFVCMHCREEPVPPFPDVNAFRDEVVEQQIHSVLLCQLEGTTETKQRAKMDQADRDMLAVEKGIERLRELRSVAVEARVNLIRALFDTSQHRSG